MRAYNRRPNTTCSRCGVPVYKTPKRIETGTPVFCSTECYHGTLKNVLYKCPQCGEDFTPRDSIQKYCSRSCSGKSRRNMKYQKGMARNKSKSRLEKLQEMFEFKSCMIRNCSYNRTYDVHRLIPGKDGGRYVVGNMFAICPNHHAEVTRGLIDLKKIDDQTLQADMTE